MSRIFTVTVSRAGDPRGAGDREVTDALKTMDGGRAGVALRDEVYILRVPAAVPRERIEIFARDFLAGDPTRTAVVLDGVAFPPARSGAVILALRLPGVMDPVEGSVLHALADAGVDADACRVRTARRYRLRAPSPGRDGLAALAIGVIGNPIVDEVHCFLPGEEETLADPFHEPAATGVRRIEVPLRRLDDAGLERISATGGLSLALAEMQAIRQHFQGLGRDPTDLELETLAQTWSEHCCHKTLTGPIDYQGVRIDNLLRETIFATTRELAAPYCLSVFRDNAGVIAIDDEWALTFKVETHNHPSALEPYGGAGTGTGGVIRDTLGTGLGAFPVLSTDVFCFGLLDTEPDALPAGSLHPERLIRGVVAGVRDYGNRMGIPTSNGAIVFHPGYIGNPLVFCGSMGLIPRRAVEKRVLPGDRIVAVGGRTGRDGIHGATFSSRELTEESETISAGAVQIGNPIEERKLLYALMRARDAGLYRAITDCGAGGFSSAVGEMAAECGADVELSQVRLKYPGLAPAEIWISEAQERMVLAVPPASEERLFQILAEEEVEGCLLGRFTDDGVLRVRFQGEVAGELDMKFLHEGRPRIARRARRPEAVRAVDVDLEGAALDGVFRALLAHPNIASKEAVIRQYDHEVQGRMQIRPLQGARWDGPGDGAAFDPLRDGRYTVVVGCGLLPLLGEIDPYQMGAQAVDEAVRNVMATGGSLARLALLDNFAWGNVDEPDQLGALIECARGAAAAARAYRAPFISGKDSLHNTYRAGGVARSIPHTLLVSAVSVVEGVARAPTVDLKRAGSALCLLGPARSALTGSLVQFLYGGTGGDASPFEAALGRKVLEALESWIAEHALRACHDVSDGGLAVAAAEMAFAGGGEGLRLDLDHESLRTLGDLELLFGEGPHRFLIEVAPERADALFADAARNGVPLARVGTVTGDGQFVVRRRGNTSIDGEVRELGRIWRAPLDRLWPDPA